MKKLSLVLTALSMIGSLRGLAAEDPVATARGLYQSASYEEALALLDRLKPTVSAPDASMVAQYRAYCLLALNRQTEAETAIEEVVKADLLFVPSENDVSPRVRTAFQSVRRRLLPAAVQAEYALAKATFDRKDYRGAADQFSRLNLLLQDPQLEGVAGVADLRTLGAGFHDLAVAATPAPEPVREPAPPPVIAPAPAVPPSPKVYDATDPGIVPPIAERQDIPDYPGPVVKVGMNRQATLEIVIDEMGRVEKAMLRQRIDPRYDALLLNAATMWRYTPARASDGRAVKFFKRLQITIK